MFAESSHGQRQQGEDDDYIRMFMSYWCKLENDAELTVDLLASTDEADIKYSVEHYVLVFDLTCCVCFFQW